MVLSEEVTSLPELPALSAATLCEAFQLTAAQFADSTALRTPGDERSLTWRQWADAVRRAAGGLASVGISRGDTVALMMTNRPEFNIVDMAALHLGATPFSIYNSSAAEQVAYLFSNAGNRVVVAERQFVDVIRASGADVDIVVLEDGLPDADLDDFDARWQAVEPGDIATLIYTSGTTGPPKGVQLTHGNLMASLQGWGAGGFLDPGGRLVSYLPLAHIADRFLHYYWALGTGASITCVSDPTALLPAMVDTRPTGVLMVPRIWEKIKASLEAKGIADPAALPEDAKAAVRAQLGLDEAWWAGSGAAPISPAVLEYFLALGIPILEGWAMSETGCAGTISPRDDVRVGSVGRLLPNVESKVADDGELLVRGPSIMIGYRNDPEKTAEAIDEDGWLHTGDVVTIDEDGYVKIVDRKKELIITAGGKNISPANIEQKLKSSSPLIGQACVIGDNRPYLVALVVLDPDGAMAYATANGLDPSSATLAADAKVQELVADAVEGVNASLSRVEQVKRFTILGVDWLPDGAELTPTMKLKRRGVHANHADTIEALYA